MINDQPVQQQPILPPQSIKSSSKKTKKAPQQLQRVPQQVVKDFVPLYKSPTAQALKNNQ